MVDSEYSPDNSLKISIEVIIRNPEILRFVPDYLKIKRKCKNAVKKQLFVIRYVPHQDKTKEVYDTVAQENDGTLIFIYPLYKNKKNV